jgi:hypothetical protein
MPDDVEIIVCPRAIGGRPDGIVHFRFNGELFLAVRGVQDAEAYKDRIRRLSQHQSRRDIRQCPECGQTLII